MNNVKFSPRIWLFLSVFISLTLTTQARAFDEINLGYFSDVALNEQLGGGNIDIQNEMLLELHELDRLTDLRAFWN